MGGVATASIWGALEYMAVVTCAEFVATERSRPGVGGGLPTNCFFSHMWDEVGWFPTQSPITKVLYLHSVKNI
jgi:hypothetical protein